MLILLPFSFPSYFLINCIAGLESALATFPDDFQIITLLAELHRDVGNSEKAVSYAKRLVELSPNDQYAAEFLKELQNLLN